MASKGCHGNTAPRAANGMRDQRIAGDARTVPTAAQIMQIAGESRNHGPTSDRVASSKPTNPCASSLFLVTGDTVFIFSARYHARLGVLRVTPYPSVLT